MNLIETLNNTEKDLNTGEYCVAFDLIANTKKNISNDEMKNIKYRFSKKISYLLFKISPIVFLLIICVMLIDIFY